MTYKNARKVNLPALLGAPLAALQWRLLLLWLVFLLLPTAVVALPLWRALAGLLDRSVHAAAWAQHLDGLMLSDVLSAMSNQGAWLSGTGLLALALALLLEPLLAGMTVAAGRVGRVLSLGQLLQSGVIEYGRMFRLMLWSLLPYAIAFGGAALAFTAAHKQAEGALLESRDNLYQHLAVGVLAVLFVLAHALVESARAAFIADAGLRSATRALGRGLMQLLRRPLSTLLAYLLVGLIGYGLAIVCGVWRIHTPALGLSGFLMALLASELAVLAIGWTRVARLFALAEVSRSLLATRRGAGLPPGL
jgi:hypothetical protein